MPRPAPRLSHWLLAGLLAAGAALAGAALAVAWLMRLAFPAGGAWALTGLSLPSLSSGPCPASRLPGSGPALALMAEGETRRGLLNVLSTLTRRGWSTVTPFSVPLDVLPPQAAVLDLGFAQLRAYQRLSLVETRERHTRVVSLNAIVFCPP